MGAGRYPREDAATYDMICAADTVGVFQIESRAQMSMLPRLQPRVFYDLVVEVAIVRPGPHPGRHGAPYLQARERRRHGQPLELEKPELEAALARTLGVPIFQEQVMQIAMIAAGFGPWHGRRPAPVHGRLEAQRGGVHRFERPLIGGMEARLPHRIRPGHLFGRCWALANTAFLKATPTSFALLSYASSWLKCHEPACFLAALLSSLPMGFTALRNWCKTRAATACACCPSTCWPATAIAPSKARCAVPNALLPALRMGGCGWSVAATAADSGWCRSATLHGRGRASQRCSAAPALAPGLAACHVSPAPKTWPCVRS